MKPAPPVTSTRSPIRGSLRGALRPALAGLGLALAALGLLACGGSSSSSTASGPRRAAEPADSPPPPTRPAGRSAPVGTEPEGVAWDAAVGLVAVGVRRPAAIAFVDPASLRVVRRVPLPEPPRHLAYDRGARAVLVPAERADQLLEVRPGGVVSKAPTGTHPHDAAAVGERVFVADEHSDQVTVLADARPLRTLPAPHQPGGIAAIAGRWVALVAVSARVLQVYDARSLRPLGRVPAGVGPSHILARGRLAYVADTQGDRIVTYRIGPRPRLLSRTPAPGTPYGLAVDGRRDRLWVTLTATDRVAEFALGPRPRLLATFPTLAQPNSVAVDERTGAVFVAGRDSGRIERIDPREGAS
jgi:DNA-binding beta-propeller fold protein YncE